MKKSVSIISVSMSLLTASLTIPSGRVYADDNPPAITDSVKICAKIGNGSNS
jgi:hypothetical protein